MVYVKTADKSMTLLDKSMTHLDKSMTFKRLYNL